MTLERKRSRQFEQGFKEEAVRLWLGSGKAATEVARELGISAQRLYAWKKRLMPEGAASSLVRPSLEELEAQNARLHREVEYLREQRDILKKTLGILSEVPRSVTGGLRP